MILRIIDDPIANELIDQLDLISRGGFRCGDCNHEIDVPAFSGVLTKTAPFNRAGEFSALPELKGVTGLPYRVLQDFDARCFEGNPTRRPLAAPAQFAFPELLTTGCVLFADRLNGWGMQS